MCLDCIVRIVKLEERYVLKFRAQPTQTISDKLATHVFVHSVCNFDVLHKSYRSQFIEFSLTLFVHFRIGGTVGAVLTCPLEVVKTRLQSSVATFEPVCLQSVGSKINLISNNNINYSAISNRVHTTSCAQGTIAAERALQLAHSRSVGLYFCLRYSI